MSSFLRLPGARASRAAVLWFLAASLAVVARATIGSALQTQLGNPTAATSDPANHAHYLIQRDQYGLDYADATRQPNWVSWDLTTSDVGSSGRSSFIQDTTLPAGFYQVLTTDYSGSGYDRGHMCPSADRTGTVADNQQVFYMSNMVPQTPDNNQGVWANFETYCRSLASAGNEVLITCGPSGFGGSTIASGVAIPGYTWKIVVVVPLGSGPAVSRITSSTRVIAIKVPNIAGVRNSPWQNFVTSAAQIEADTGCSFFSALPASVASALRTQVDGQSATGAPVIVTQPSNQTTVVGGSATFSVTASGDSPLTYQWLKDDTEVAGATNATLTVAPVAATDAGAYSVVVTNPVGSVTSNDAQLIINGLPPVVSIAPTSVSANAGSTVILTSTVSGSPTFTYQWRKDGSAVAGASSATLTLANIQSADAGSYDLVVTNSVSSATSAPALVAVTDVRPTITTQPSAVSAAVGGNATFSVAASGTSPMTYQWRKAGVALADGGIVSGATSATLTLTGISNADAALYDVVVTNTLGSDTSTAVQLTVNAPAAAAIVWNFNTASPSSNAVVGVSAGDVTQNNNNGSTTMLGTTSASSGYSGASGGNNAGAAARTGALNTSASGSAYFEFTLTPAGGKRVVLSGIAFGTRSTSTGPQAYAIFTSSDNYASAVATGTIGNNSAWSLKTASFASVTGTTDGPVTVRIYGYNGTGSPGAGTANWRIDDLSVSASSVFPPPVAPAVTSTSPAAGATNIVVTTPITITFNEAVSFTGSWFTLNSATNGSMAATVTGGPITYSLNPPSSFAYNDTVTVAVNAANVVDQATGTIHGAGTTTFSFQTGVYVPPTPAAVTGQPVSQTVVAGNSASFTVTANGTAPITYLWRKNGAAISGNASASTATLTLTNVSTTDAATYDCVVSNLAGSDVSHPATLTVTVLPPTISTPPASVLATLGGSATFNVTATGTAPFTYQWRKNGTPLTDGASVTGSTTATLNVSNLTTSAAGTYDVVVTNSRSSVTSSAAQLAIVDSVGQITWDFTTASPTSGLADVTGGTVSQGNNNGTTALLTTTSASGSYAGASGGNNAGAAARVGSYDPATSAYFEFTFTPVAGRQFVASAIGFGMRSTSTGPQAYALYSSVDNFTAPLATSIVPNTSAWRFYTSNFTPVVGAPDQAITFRLFGYNGTGSPGSNTANWRVDDLQLTAGVLAAAPILTASPVSQTVTVGDSVTFTAAASGSAPLSFQWRKGGAPISGATNAVLSLAGVTTAQAGSYDVVVSNPLGSVPSATAILTVNKATAVVALSDLAATYDGTAHPATVTTTPAGLHTTMTYGGSATAPTDAGSYEVVATVDDVDYVGSAKATLVISPAPATVTLGNLVQTYDGSPKTATVTTSPAGVATAVTYDAVAAAPVAAGSYAVAATVTNPNYVGSATGTLLINKAPAAITLSGLVQFYDGLPKPVIATATPSNLPVTITYAGESVAPTYPGKYSIVATVIDPNYAATVTDTLEVTVASIVRHAPQLNGGVDGSLQVLSSESMTLNSSAWMSGDLLVPGTPTVRLNGRPTLAGIREANGATLPSNYQVTLNGGAVLRYVVRRADPATLPVVAAPAAPTGTQSVAINRADYAAIDFTTLRNLTLNTTADVAIPAGTYGSLVANGGGSFVFGTPGATQPAVYQLQSLTLNGSASLKVVGPVIITLGNSVVFNSSQVGSPQHPEWLTVRVASGDVTLNGSAAVYGSILAPTSTLTVNGKLVGTTVSDRLIVNGSGSIEQP